VEACSARKATRKRIAAEMIIITSDSELEFKFISGAHIILFVYSELC